jgi:hypothetical protein
MGRLTSDVFLCLAISKVAKALLLELFNLLCGQQELGNLVNLTVVALWQHFAQREEGEILIRQGNARICLFSVEFPLKCSTKANLHFH